MKKLASLILAVILVLAMAVPAMAATVNVENHAYVAYQIFTGTQAESEGALGNVVWGDGVNNEAFLAALKADATIGAAFTDCTTAAQVAEVIATYNDDSTQAKIVAKLAYANKSTTSTSLSAGATELEDGYYLIVDVTSDVGVGGAYNTALLQVTKDITIANKTSAPEVQKKVDDKNDSNNTEDAIVWNDSADYDIGDAVPFQLKATLADNVSDYNTYKIVFHDTMSKGLTFKTDSVKVYLGKDEATRKDVTGYFTTNPGTYSETEGTKITFTCNDVKAFGAGNSDVIVVEYTATLNENAVIGNMGNPNYVYLEYSNNPNWIVGENNGKDDDNDGTVDEEGEENNEGPTGKTPEDKVIVFTYTVVANKVTKNPAYTGEEGSTEPEHIPLEGAGFTLYKKNAADEYVKVGEELKGEGKVTFEWTGLDDGDYMIEESTTPAGYNTIAPIYFTITAEHEILWEKQDQDQVLTKLDGGNVVTGEVSTGVLSTDVVNVSGSTLPTTGGMGTTLIYAVGALLVAGAVVVMISKKRAASK